MKHLFCIGLILLCLACASDPQKGMEKKIIGEWCNPYTYESTGELKGFHFKKGGVCEAINIPSLDLKTWSIQEGYLLIKGFSLEEDGKKEVYETKEKIDLLNADTLSVVAREANPRLVFLYLNAKIIKERVRVDTMSHE
ncbi:MAG TPA: lipocalin family protein [Butyricimonas virosa]|uniref:Lipocalin family protein n=1 Tax=Butyricimonas virosa TaxID=544645 RepID=A0A921KXP3_9BACT|nr:lipocalin family protein [Butyricimonas virosa]